MTKNVLCLAALAVVLYGCRKDDTAVSDTCTITEQRAHPLSPEARLFIPNAFTPDGDGLNDFFGPLTAGIATIDFSIFDERNNRVFHSTQTGQYWSAPATSKTDRYRYQVSATTTGGDELAWCGEVYAITCLSKNIHAGTLIFADQFDPNVPEGYLAPTQQRLSACD